MQTVNIHEAKTNLSRLLEQVETGEEIIIARYGKPIAKLSALTQETLPPRELGRLKGRIWISDAFDAHDDEIAELFYGEPDAPP